MAIILILCSNSLRVGDSRNDVNNVNNVPN